MKYMNLEDFELCLECITVGAHKYSPADIYIFYDCVGKPGIECYRIREIRNKGQGQY